MIDLLKFDLSANNRTSASFGKMKRELGGIRGAVAGVNDYAQRAGKSMRNIGAGLTAGVTAPLALLAKDSIRALDQQVQAERSVEQAIASTGGTAGRSLEDLKRAASGLQGVTLFGDEDILRNVTAPLLTFTNVQEDVFDRTQANILDVATLLKTDLKSATLQVGKALNDPVKGLGGLSRAGIQFSEDQKQVIKALVETGDVAAAQGLILDELEKQFSGQAAAAADTPLGKWKQLSNAVGDVKEQLGEQIVPFLTPILEKVEGAIKWFGDLSDETKRMGVMIAGVAAAGGPLLAFFGLAVMGVGTLTTALATMGAVLMANPIIAIIAAVAAGAYLIYRNWEGISGWFSNLWDGVKTVTSAAWDNLKSIFMNYTAAGLVYQNWDGIKAWFADLWASVKTGVESGWALIKSVLTGEYSVEALVKDAWSGLGDWFASLGPQITEGFVALWGSIKTEVSQWPARMLDYGKQMVSSLIAGIKGEDITTPMEEFLSSEASKVKTEAWLNGKATAEAMSSGIFVGVQGSKPTLGAAVDEITDFLESRTKKNIESNSPSRVFAEIGGDVVDGLALGLRDNRETALSEIRSISDALGGELNSGVQTSESAAQSLRSSWTSALSDLAKGASSAKEAVGSLLNSLADLLLNSAFNSLLGPITESIGAALFPNANGNAFFGGQVVPFAKGGVVSSPTMFGMSGSKTGLMGESGPEAILPLTRVSGGRLGVRAEGAQGGGASITLNFAPVIDARGADSAAVARIEEQQRQMAVEFEGRVHGALRTGRNTRRNKSWGG